MKSLKILSLVMFVLFFCIASGLSQIKTSQFEVINENTNLPDSVITIESTYSPNPSPAAPPPPAGPSSSRPGS